MQNSTKNSKICPSSIKQNPTFFFKCLPHIKNALKDKTLQNSSPTESKKINRLL